jgi:hypothetical protein
MPQAERGRTNAMAGIAMLALGLAGGACSRNGAFSLASSRTILSPSDFSKEGALPPTEPTAPDPLLEGATYTGPIAASQGIMDVVATPGDPILSTTAAPVGQPQFVDAKIGDVNGKPVFASAFFDRGTATAPPLGPRLSAEASLKNRREWTAFAREQITQTLQGFVVDELLEAEARSKLTEEQRQGLRYFVDTIQKDLVSANRGSRSRAEESLGGRTVTDFKREREQELLIRRELATLDQKTIVSPRDIENAWERQQDQYNPPSEARFRLISVEEAATDSVKKITDLLTAGTPFAQVAEDPANGQLVVPRKGEETRQFRGAYAEATFFPIEPLQNAAVSLAKGGWTGPVRVASASGSADLYWIALEQLIIEERTLADTQLIIYNDLQQRRFRRERELYINRLAERASFTSIDEMTMRLMAIAEARYLPTVALRDR